MNKESKNSYTDSNSECETAEYFFKKSKKCPECNRYIVDDSQFRMDDVREMLSDFCLNDTITFEGTTDSRCISCENERQREAIFSNKQCKRCDRYILQAHQRKWNLVGLFDDCFFKVARFEGSIKNICEYCEGEMSERQKKKMREKIE